MAELLVEEVVVMVAIMAELFGWQRLWRCGSDVTVMMVTAE